MNSSAAECALDTRSSPALATNIKRGLSGLTVYAVLGAGLSWCGLMLDALNEKVEAAGTSLAAPAGVQDARVLSVESSENTEGLTEKEMTAAIKRADKTIRFSTAGARGLGAVSIETITSEPEGIATVKTVEIPCYTSEQIETFYERMFPDGRRALADPNTQHMIVLENDSACTAYSDNWAAYAKNVGDAPMTVYNFQTLGIGYLPSTIDHEIGHTFGLGHAPRIICSDTGKGQLYTSKSVQWQLEHGCTTQKSQDGSIDVYASKQTVMGYSWETDMTGRSFPYSAVEMSKLNPAFHIETVEPTPGVYRIAMEPGKSIGIRMVLPADHALKGVVKDADAVIFALNDKGGWWEKPKKGEKISVSDPRINYEPSIYVTSTTNNQVVSLDTAGYGPLGSLAEFDAIFGAENEGVLVEPTPLYLDEQLGVSVRFGMSKDGYFIDVKDIKATSDTALRYDR